MRRLRKMADRCSEVLFTARIEDKFSTLVLIAMAWGGVDYDEAADIVAEAYPIMFRDAAAVTGYLELVLAFAGCEETAPHISFTAMAEVVKTIENRVHA